MQSFMNTSFKPMFLDKLKFANDSLREEADKICQGDISCLFDVASTRDLEVGQNTKQLNTQLVNDSKIMSKYVHGEKRSLSSLFNTPVSFFVLFVCLFVFLFLSFFSFFLPVFFFLFVCFLCG